MKSFEYVCAPAAGLHARAAAMIAAACVAMPSVVTIACNGKEAIGTDVLKINALAAKKGDTLKISVEGGDEDAAVAKMKEVLAEVDSTKDTNHDVLRIAFFGVKDYDKVYFDALASGKGEGSYNVEISYIEPRLTTETAYLAEGFNAICIFVNDEAPAEVLDELNKYGVKLILLRCAGFNNVDLDVAKKYGMTVLRVPAYSPYAVAEHAMAILQAANRHLHKAYNKVRANNYALNGLLGFDLHNKVAGIVTTGKIGQCMARICKGYGMTVLAWDKFPNKALEEEGLLTYVEKEELFAKADLISIHGPLIMGEGGTYHIIDDKAISLMKDNVMLVNTARGGMVDTEALFKALKAGKFQAVALDVYEGENANVYTDHSFDVDFDDVTARLTAFPQVIVTSHQAFFTREALQAIATETLDNARNFMQGLPYGVHEVK